MQAEPLKTDVIVIGGGLAGLATATLLARGGRQVRLFEQSYELGGRARTKDQDGFLLNIGPHALYRSGAGFKVLQEPGVEPRGGLPSISGAYAVRDGVKHTFPAGPVSLLTTSLFSLGAKLETARLLGSIPRMDTTSLMGNTVGEWVTNRISRPEVRELLLATFRVATYTNAPDLLSAGAAIEQVKKALDKNVLYLDGGWQSLVDGLTDSARQAGVTIETGVRVEKVERGPNGAVERVRVNNHQSHFASTVVIASSPSAAASMLQEGERTSLGVWARGSVPVRAACLDVALKHLPNPKATFALGIDRPLYMSVHSATARLAPEGAALIHLAQYLPPDYESRPAADQRELEGLLELVQPGWRDQVVYQRFLPEMTVVNGMVLARTEGTRLRPGPEVPDVPGLFVVGDWVGSEGMLADASLASAKQAADTIVSNVSRLAFDVSRSVS